MNFQELLDRYAWEPIAGCEGRYRAPRGLGDISFEALAETRPIRGRNAKCHDILLYAPIAGGGVISYEKPDGRILHTLCNSGGYLRKLRMLGLLNEDNWPLCPQCKTHRFTLEYRGQRLLWCPRCDGYENSASDLTAWIAALEPASSNPKAYLKHERYQHAYYVEEFRKALHNLLSSCGAAVPAQSLWELPIEVERAEFTDPRDQQVYRTVRIGNQTWMAQNMNYRVPDGICFSEEPDLLDIRRKDGLHYDWNTAQRAAPPGWHVASTQEWGELANYVASHSEACQHYGKGWSGVGFELKSVDGWLHSPPDRFGFTAQCCGTFTFSGMCIFPDVAGWWTANEQDAQNAMTSCITRLHDTLTIFSYDKNTLCSVRCVKDSENAPVPPKAELHAIAEDQPRENPERPTDLAPQKKWMGWSTWLKSI